MRNTNIAKSSTGQPSNVSRVWKRVSRRGRPKSTVVAAVVSAPIGTAAF